MQLQSDINGTHCSDICLKKIQWLRQLALPLHTYVLERLGVKILWPGQLDQYPRKPFKYNSKKYFNHFSEKNKKKNKMKTSENRFYFILFLYLSPDGKK